MSYLNYKIEQQEEILTDVTEQRKKGSIINFPNKKQRELIYNAKMNVDVKDLASTKKQNKLEGAIYLTVKRIVDIFAGLLGLIILIPLTVIVYICNKIFGDKGPIFYKQKRIGKDGKIFEILKYRSMVVGADEELEKYLQENEKARIEYKKYKKLKYDPRITKIGSFLRKTSLDEFPQLLLLLTGKMTLVGPRPYLPREIDDMGEYYNIIIKSKPRNWWAMAMWSTFRGYF